MVPNQERAKQVIVEILRQSKCTMNKTQVFKTFWLAHLFFTNENRGYLSDWPIVKMPNGPGIDKSQVLFDKIATEYEVKSTWVRTGPFNECLFQPVSDEVVSGLPENAIKAVKEAVDFAANKSAKSLSELSHEYSRGWREKQLGEEIDIYADSITDEEIGHSRAEIAFAREQYQGLFE